MVITRYRRQHQANAPRVRTLGDANYYPYTDGNSDLYYSVTYHFRTSSPD